MTLPAQKIAIAIWLFAAGFFVLQQMRQPIFTRDLFHNDRGMEIMVTALANAFIYPGVIVGLGAIVHLLGEIRDATARRETKP